MRCAARSCSSTGQTRGDVATASPVLPPPSRRLTRWDSSAGRRSSNWPPRRSPTPRWARPGTARCRPATTTSSVHTSSARGGRGSRGGRGAGSRRGAAAVFRWTAQRGAGLQVSASGPASSPGTVVLMTAGLPRLGLDIPCRVVWVVDQPDRRGFGYGTLPGHPESGEESFVVSLRPDGEVVYELRAFSRPGTRLSRLGGRVSGRLQTLALDRYVRAIRRAAG